MDYGNSRKNTRKILWMVGIIAGVVFCSLWTTGRASASSANVSIRTSANTVETGDVVYVIITVTSSSEISGFEGYFSYDNRVLQFQTGGSVVYGNDDAFRVEDVEREGGSTSIKYSIKFLAHKEGSTTITLKKPYNVFGESTSDKMSVSYNALTIVVREKVDGSATTSEPSSSAEVKQTKKPAKKKKAKTTKVPKATEVAKDLQTNPEKTDEGIAVATADSEMDSENSDSSLESQEEWQEELSVQRSKYMVGIFIAFSALLLLAVITLCLNHHSRHQEDAETKSEREE